MGPGACSDISVSLVTCTLGRLRSRRDRKSPECLPPSRSPKPWAAHTHNRWQGPQQCLLVLSQALILRVQLLDLSQALPPRGPVLGHSLVQGLVRGQLSPLLVGQEDWGLGRCVNGGQQLTRHSRIKLETPRLASCASQCPQELRGSNGGSGKGGALREGGLHGAQGQAGERLSGTHTRTF